MTRSLYFWFQSFLCTLFPYIILGFWKVRFCLCFWSDFCMASICFKFSRLPFEIGGNGISALVRAVTEKMWKFTMVTYGCRWASEALNFQQPCFKLFLKTYMIEKYKKSGYWISNWGGVSWVWGKEMICRLQAPSAFQPPIWLAMLPLFLFQLYFYSPLGSWTYPEFQTHQPKPVLFYYCQ